MTTNIVSITPRETDTLMRVRDIVENKIVPASQIAKAIGVSPATMSQLLNNRYAANPAQIIEKLGNWLTRRDERTNSPVINPGFVMTETAALITRDLQYAHVTNSIVLIFGASGVGKSQTLREYAKSNTNVWLVTASPSRGSITECLYELAMELGLDQAPRRKGPLARVIRRRLNGTDGLLIIDEADHLDYPTLEELRILQEECQIGMVLVGNNRVYTQLTGGRRNEDFARLFSRIAKKRGIHKIRQRDVQQIAEAWRIDGKDERNLMTQISDRPGGLRLLTKTLGLAAMNSEHGKIDTALLRSAFNELTSEA